MSFYHLQSVPFKFSNRRKNDRNGDSYVQDGKTKSTEASEESPTKDLEIHNFRSHCDCPNDCGGIFYC